MFNFLLGLILLIIFMVVFISSYRRNRDLFSPLCIFSLLQGLRYVPDMMTSSVHYSISGIEKEYFRVFGIELLVLTFVLFGYYSVKWNYNYEYKVTYKGKDKNVANMSNILMWGGAVATIIGLIFTYLFIKRVGGLAYVLTHSKDMAYNNGVAYISSLRFLVVFGTLLFMASKKRIGIAFGIISFIVYCMSFLIFTSRSPVFEAVLILLMFINYAYSKYRIRDFFKPRYLVFFASAVFIIALLPQIRDSGGFTSNYTYESKMGSVFGTFLNQFSYTGRDAFAYSHFGLDNFWYGRNFINVICAPLPSAIFSWKPPVDDGMYLCNLMRGYNVVPPSNVFPIYNSIPFSTQSSMYANFGIVGVIVGSIIIGRLYAKAYMRIKDIGGDPLMVVVYFAIVYQLELSSLSIVQTLIPVVLGFVFFKVMFGWRIVKCYYDDN